jgi:hypothetical protein
MCDVLTMSLDIAFGLWADYCVAELLVAILIVNATYIYVFRNGSLSVPSAIFTHMMSLPQG